MPVRATTIRGDMVLCFSNRLRGRNRWSTVEIEPTEGGQAGILRHLGRPILTAVVTDFRGVMADAVRAQGFLPHRNPSRSEVEPAGGPSPPPGS